MDVLNQGNAKLFFKGSFGYFSFIPDDPKPDVNIQYHRAWGSYTWIKDYKTFWQPHKATKVIELGYFCNICGMQVINPYDQPLRAGVPFKVHHCPDPGGRGIHYINY